MQPTKKHKTVRLDAAGVRAIETVCGALFFAFLLRGGHPHPHPPRGCTVCAGSATQYHGSSRLHVNNCHGCVGMLAARMCVDVCGCVWMWMCVRARVRARVCACKEEGHICCVILTWTGRGFFSAGQGIRKTRKV